MKILELFSGTESFSKVAREQGHICFTIDINPKFNPSLVKNILALKFKDIPFIPDVIWASPPCEQYSHAKRKGERKIEEANENVKKVLLIREWFSNSKPILIIENPQTGLLKNQEFMNGLPYTDVSYCKYGMPYRKQTRLWNNINLVLETCNKDCKFMNGRKHIGSVGNGRMKYTNRSYNREEKYHIPRQIILSILNQIQK